MLAATRFKFRNNETDRIAYALRVSPTDNPSIIRMLNTLVQNMPALVKHRQDPRMRDEAIETNITLPLLRQFNAIRMHTRPFYLHADDIGEEVYCAVIMANYGRYIWKDSRTCADNIDEPRWDSMRGAINILSVVHAFEKTPGVSPDDLAHLPFEGQIVIIAHACYTAERFLDALQMNAAASEIDDPVIRQQGMDMAFETLTTYDQLLAPHLSTLADCYRRLMEIVRLQRDYSLYSDLQTSAQPHRLRILTGGKADKTRLN